ncbi:cytochrome aa3 quinol oxidase subunit III [Virgibacillus ihumii]|uniref:cytochrome aa3 quinol oxidase subunit III n=1 Tax=Virgibacillus ihumii TaxID=2686091 RepID=UPI00157CCE76|nr:cytochrome aa3 quinol oxidase subunit III [Virgibacillus ihumii]
MSEHDLKTGPLEYRTEAGRLNITGFWIFLAAEIVLFSTLFATYAVLIGRTGDAPLPSEIFEAKSALLMTFILLTSSFTCGLGIHAMRNGSKKGLITWLIITLLLGLSFLGLEVEEFILYTHEGVTLQTSAYWSAFFVLAGTHGVHVTFGVGWLILLLIQVFRRGLTKVTTQKVFIIGLYWHFLDVVWIFIFTCVYLFGMVM